MQARKTQAHKRSRKPTIYLFNMKTFNFILHLSDFVLFTFAARDVIPYEFAIMTELFAIFNNTQYK